jgi:hypothetical protein
MKSKVLQRPMFMSPDEVENVGIMQGFMDDMEDVFAEDEEEDSDEAAAARMMGRTPDSPEILMNNLRGDVRSVDARVEELADMVGYRAASETPMEVLALLQPVLAGQGAGQGIAALPMGGAPGQAMPPMPDALPAMPPEAQAAGAPPAMPAGGIASLPQGDTMPMQMAKGGIVQRFKEGSDDGGVTQVNNAPSLDDLRSSLQGDSADVLLNFLRRRPAEVPTLQGAMQSRLPEYQALLGTGDKDSMRASMLFDIAQAALGYAGNVSPQGQPLRGSQAARLAGAVSGLPGQIGTRLAAQQQQDQAVRMAALQAGEKEIEGIRGANQALLGEQRSVMQTLAKEPTPRKSFRMLTKEELASNFPELDASLPWGVDETGEPSIAGGRPPAGSAESDLMTPARNLRIVTENASLYAEGALTPEQMREFEMAYAQVDQPTPYNETDQYGNVTTRYRKASIPESVRDLYAAGQLRSYGEARDTGTPTVGTGAATTAPAGAPAPTDLESATVRTPMDIPPAQVMPFSEQYKSDLPTLWNSSDAAAITSRVSVFADRLPFIAPLLTRAESAQDTQQQVLVEMVSNLMTNAFRADRSGRLAEGERTEITENINLLKKVIDNPQAFQARLVGLDDVLQNVFVAARAQRNDPGSSPTQKEDAARAMSQVHEIRTYMGVPAHARNDTLVEDPNTGSIRFQDPRLLEIVVRAPEGASVLLSQTGQYLEITPALKQVATDMASQRR